MQHVREKRNATHVGEEKCNQNFNGKPKGKKLLGRRRYEW
jgi:hypothetical protein